MSDEETLPPESEGRTEQPVPDLSPFALPPLDAEAKGPHEAAELEASPFWQPPVAGIPYESGSEEDRAIRAVIAEAEQTRRAGRSAGPTP